MTVQDVVKDNHCNCTEDLETSQDSRKFIINIGTGQFPGNWTRRSPWMNRIQLCDEGQDKGKFVAIASTDQSMVGNNMDDAGACQAGQAKLVLESSEHVACQVKIQEKVETTWLFGTGADAHVMPKHVWEQLGELTLQPTSVTLKGANGQDLGAIGEVLVRGFDGRVKVQFKAVVARQDDAP